MAFRSGQKVVCVKLIPVNAGYGYGIEIVPTVGEVYTIRETGTFYDLQFVRLNEIHNHPRLYAIGTVECWFTADAFRPAIERKTDISVFRRILDDVSAGKTPEITNAPDQRRDTMTDHQRD